VWRLASGTVAGAIEGTILGVPSIALSQAYGPSGRDKIPWECGQTHAPQLVRRLIAEGIPPGVLININFPACEPDDVAGIAVAVQGTRTQELLRIDEREDGRGERGRSGDKSTQQQRKISEYFLDSPHSPLCHTLCLL
jgi:5'-nucleotidase